MSWPRALAAWLLIVTAETVHGTLLQLFLAPAIGDLRARQVGVLVGSLIIFGAAWLVLIVAFEFALGTALGYSRTRMLEDYDLTAGGYMGFGLLFLLLAPSLAARVRGFGPGA